jgi:hypothetical protein
MSEDRLRSLLRGVSVPDADEAERRGLEVVQEAFAQRHQPRRNPLPRIAIAVAVGALLAALTLSPAGAAVRSWIGDVFATSVPRPQPALTSLPGGGRLLVQSENGPWVVHPDGSRRLLGRYTEAAWSPHGLFVVVASGQTLSAVEPDGTPHWSASAKARVSDPRWSPSGFRIAYRAGDALHVIAADGTADRLIDPAVAPVPAAWFPPGLQLLAYVDRSGRLRVVDADTGKVLGSVKARPGVDSLSWAADGSALLETTSRGLWLHSVRVRKLAERLSLGPAQRIALPAGAGVGAAAFSPRANAIAALLQLAPRAGGTRSELVIVHPAGSTRQRIFGVSGGLSGLAWSPGGKRLVLGWPEADEWLFIPVGQGRIRAVSGIGRAFSPGTAARSPMPEIDGWCCARGVAGGG